MRFQLCSLYDMKVRVFMRPFTVAHVSMAQEALASAVNDPEHPCSAHPEDYTLFHIGTFDDDTGRIDSFSQPVHVALASSYQKKEMAYVQQ